MMTIYTYTGDADSGWDILRDGEAILALPVGTHVLVVGAVTCVIDQEVKRATR